MRSVKILLILISVVLFWGCETNNQKMLVDNSIKALKAVNSATATKTSGFKFNFDNYLEKLSEAKKEVNIAKSKMPDGELMNEIKVALISFEDVSSILNGNATSTDGSNIGLKYGIKQKIDEHTLSLDVEFKARAALMQIILIKANEHLEKASKLAGNL